MAVGLKLASKCQLFLSVITEVKVLVGLKPESKYMGGGRGRGRENAKGDRDVYFLA